MTGIRAFIRNTFHAHESFTARDVTKAAKAAGIKPKRGSVTDELWRMWDVRRVPEKERSIGNGFRGEQGVATRVYTFQPRS